ncbi:MAG: hypothetical protein ACK4EX_01740 [Thermaurantimonas sp.]|uniref:hypothetical protein n=1 Tax=Thermaurantimonas sp. TaxID=2681568 RepID=UPI00391B3355
MIIKKSKSILFEYVFESLALAFLIMSFFIVALSYSKLPASINLNFGFAGSLEKEGHKLNLFFLPSISAILYFLLSALQKNPEHLVSLLKKDEKRNSEEVLRVSIRFLILVKFIINLSGFLITYQTIYNPLQDNFILSKFMLPIVLVVLLFPLVLLIYRFASELRKMVK